MEGTDLAVQGARAKLLRSGAKAVGDGALLALWLGLGAPRQGERLIESLGGLCLLARAPAARLLDESGMGPVRVARLLAARELLERQFLEGLHEEGPLLSSSSSVRAFLRARLAPVPREVFGCLFLDSRHRLIRYESLFLGTVDRASVHPREVLRRALELNAAAVILAHNHPSGVAEPSASDLALTQDLVELLGRIEVRVLDHLVVGRGSEVSFAERGLL